METSKIIKRITGIEDNRSLNTNKVISSLGKPGHIIVIVMVIITVLLILFNYTNRPENKFK